MLTVGQLVAVVLAPKNGLNAAFGFRDGAEALSQNGNSVFPCFPGETRPPPGLTVNLLSSSAPSSVPTP